MEVFVKVIAEDLLTGDRNVCTLSFLTLVALDDEGNPTPVPKVVPQTAIEKQLYQTAEDRTRVRKKRRKESKEMTELFGTKLPWEDKK